ncbi:MAG: 3-hydroxyacyl-ACP dehydratase FabZ [Gammaproteobacteria bacterium]|jgi:3-hydroxyacyl-[acyl-carrier-protein] dehydratase|nr:MAG: 3-hydroxyacyl-ACP dehydratase FabZ [Gammaproteobacteria bacterium]
MAEMDIGEIMKYLPHRYPMLLIDRVVEFHHGKSLVALKNVSYNESYFQGHFPNRPVMPAVIILEAMAQATGILVLRSMDKLPSEKSVYYFVGIDGARFRRPVVPGDQLRIEVNLLRSSRGIWKLRSEASVAGDVVASGDLMGAMREIDA